MISTSRLVATLLTLVAAALPGCTIAKPLVCAFTYPIDNIRARLAAPDEPDEHEQLPPVLALAAAPVLIPLRFVSDSVIGAIGGLFSGFASDLNVVTWNFSSPARNLTRPFRTNARPRG